MTAEIMQAKMELKELVDVFSKLADMKDAAGQGELFLPDDLYRFFGRSARLFMFYSA